MAQHLRIGSVINYGGNPGGPYAYSNATVTNITDAYIEMEWTNPADSVSYVVVRSWSVTAPLVVVTD